MSNSNARSYLSVILFAVAICEPLQAADDAVRVVPESDLKSWWQAGESLTPPRYPIDALKSGAEGCVAVAFEIHSDGSVSNERVWRKQLSAGTDSALKLLEQSALLAVHQWNYVPAPTNAVRSPVYTYAVITFTLTEGYRSPERAKIKDAEFKAKCEMPDFPQQVQAMINAGTAAKGGTQ